MSSATTSSARHGLRRKSGMKKHHQRAKCCGNIVEGWRAEEGLTMSAYTASAEEERKNPSRLNNVGNLLDGVGGCGDKQRTEKKTDARVRGTY